MTTNPDDKKPKQVLATYAVVALIVMFLLNIFVLPGIMERSIRETTYSDFLKGIDSKQIQEVQFDVQDSIIYYTLKQDGKTQVCKTGLINTDSMEVGGISYVAEVMNNVDRATEKYIFDELSARDQKLADQIKQKMFVFEDIVNLDSMAIQEFTKQVDPKDLAIAIKGSTQEVAECIFSNISTRARESLQADIEYLHNVRMRDVEAAQQNIVATIRRLEQEQIITISHGGGGDEVIA